MSLPKLKFVACDETSLRVTWPDYQVPASGKLFIQYKEPHEDWSVCKQIEVALRASGVTLTPADLVDLKPGTPYFVRLKVERGDGTVDFGPDAVFDTKAIDCTPRRKRCVIS
jgi:hypothetical protein